MEDVQAVYCLRSTRLFFFFLKERSIYVVSSLECQWLSWVHLGESGVVFALEPGAQLRGWGERDQGPYWWRDLHVTCPASGVEYGTTKRYMQSLGLLALRGAAVSSRTMKPFHPPLALSPPTLTHPEARTVLGSTVPLFGYLQH